LKIVFNKSKSDDAIPEISSDRTLAFFVEGDSISISGSSESWGNRKMGTKKMMKMKIVVLI
jgi:hypothetical protein